MGALRKLVRKEKKCMKRAVKEYSKEGQKNWLSDFGEDPSLVKNADMTSDKPTYDDGESNSLKQNLFGSFFKSILT